MKIVAINALNSNSGGGKSIRDSYLKILNEQQLTERYIVITANGTDLRFVTNSKIEVIEMPRFWSKTLLAPFIYRFAISWLLKRLAVDVVLNMGDLIVHTEAKQIYFFDWPYALDVHPRVWGHMNLADWINRKVKLCLVRRHLKRPDIVVAQTEINRDRLRDLYNLQDVRVVKGAGTFNTVSGDETHDFALPSGVRLVCPAVYYPHKNLEILLDLACLIKTAKRNFHIITTVKPDTVAARRFLDSIVEKELQGIVINIGHVPSNKMNSLYRQCDALLLPTLLESFGLIYLEAMHNRLPVFTSNMWFAHAVCGDAAVYFDPFDAVDIFRSIDGVMLRMERINDLIESGTRQLGTFPSWKENFITYQKYINELLAGSNFK